MFKLLVPCMCNSLVEMALLSVLTTPYNTTLFSLLFLLFSLVFSLLKFTRRSKLNLPPSPPKLPIIGNLHQILGTLRHRSLQSLSNKYGPLMFLQLGKSPTLVVSSAEMAREILKTHDIVFATRPKTTSADIFCYKCQDVGFAPYGEYWRQARKICVLGLLSTKRVQLFQYAREEEVTALVNKIRCSCFTGDSVNLSEMLLVVSNNTISRCVIGRKAEEEGGKSKIGELSKRITQQLAAFSVGDTFPSLRWIDILTGLIGRLNATAEAFDAFLDQVIEEHKRDILESDDDQISRKDFVDMLLQLQKNGRLGMELNLKAILMDMLVAGTDTTATTIEWAMAELVINPSLMEKVQKEVRNVVKGKLKIDMKDIEEMDYLKCVIKETLRLHSPAPLLVARETSASVKLGGYDIPAKTIVYVNAWAIQRDPKVWEKPEEFLPERFLNNPVDYAGHDFQFIPFGAGRRSCPGMSFGVVAAEYVMANLLYWFDWKLPGGAVGKFDMSESFGLILHKKLPLHLVPALYSHSP